MADDQGHIFLSLHHRGRLSVGTDRYVLGQTAFHWGIVATFRSLTGDGTVRADIDPVDRIGDSRRRVLFFRPRSNPHSGYRQNNVGLLLVGAIPLSIPEFVVRAYLGQCLSPPTSSGLPVGQMDGQSASWAARSLVALQRLGFAFDFRPDQFMDYALQFADRMIASKISNSSDCLPPPPSTSPSWSGSGIKSGSVSGSSVRSSGSRSSTSSRSSASSASPTSISVKPIETVGIDVALSSPVDPTYEPGPGLAEYMFGPGFEPESCDNYALQSGFEPSTFGFVQSGYMDPGEMDGQVDLLAGLIGLGG